MEYGIWNVFVVWNWNVYVICNVQLSKGKALVSQVISPCDIRHTTYDIRHTTYDIRHMTYHIWHTTYHISHTTYPFQILYLTYLKWSPHAKSHESCLLHMTYMSNVSYIWLWHTRVMSLAYDIHESCLYLCHMKSLKNWLLRISYFIFHIPLYIYIHTYIDR